MKRVNDLLTNAANPINPPVLDEEKRNNGYQIVAALESAGWDKISKLIGNAIDDADDE